MAVEATLGVVGEVAAELEKAGDEIAIPEVEVPLIDQGGGADNPGGSATVFFSNEAPPQTDEAASTSVMFQLSHTSLV